MQAPAHANAVCTERGSAGQPLHDMWVRLTLDTQFVIHGIESAMDAYPQQMCPHAVNPMKDLVGIKVGAGWQREVQQQIGGALGCTHLRELLAPTGERSDAVLRTAMATTAMQAMGGVLRSRGTGGQRQGKGTCYAKSDEDDRAQYRSKIRVP